MYSTCLHCNAHLGTNEVIEAFPVGRRLAFDGAKGRLWVVCPKCRRWNLSPIEERWEAIEQCEREFRDTRRRTSTDNIGLAKTREGLELVRIGAPQRPEMAAWRYAREFGKRWKTRGLPLLGGIGTLLGLNVLFTAQLVSSAAVFGSMAILTVGGVTVIRRSGRARVVMPDGRVRTLTATKPLYAGLEAADEGGWALRWNDGEQAGIANGAEARRALRGLLTIRNFQGARPAGIRDAVSLLERSRSPDQFVDRVARATRPAGATSVFWYPPDVSLALEMALHEDTERRALDGELQALADEWEMAEKIAGIADDMFIAPDVRRAHDALKRSAGR